MSFPQPAAAQAGPDAAPVAPDDPVPGLVRAPLRRLLHGVGRALGQARLLRRARRAQGGLHRRPAVLPRRRGQRRPASRCSARTRCCCSTAPSTCASASCCCRRSTASACARYGELIARGRRARGRALAAPASRSRCAARMQAITLEVILRAVFGVERPGAARARCASACSTALDRAAATQLALIARAAARPRRPAGGRFARAAASASTSCSTRRSPSAARDPTSTSATTSSRCCSRPATRTARR